ncbi:hypothetical protein SAMN05444156_2877 [Verrucomicrobium sp. GAS474]|uniref:lysophospholipid acyltransferase family protein n=1 Tax=Verrucomicrobium sp. GAS474 TaxID=1882831 RepID=UPI000879B815|nr:lysophospholipid acyltransferase family protein [Verrucomicrobium sp. GAS474]SDU25357.1 hypothetical protein SAMN05444156_2877 [Verrucomicrobium sp. GAS474]
MKRLLTALLQAAIVRLAAFLIRLLSASLRFEVVDQGGVIAHPPQGPLIYAFWHNRLLLIPPIYRHFFPKRPAVVLASRSKDGELISRIVGRFNVGTARGSTSKKGGLGIRAFLRYIAEGHDAAITPDGPRGPRYRVKPGVVTAAQLSGAAIVPITYTLGWKKEIRSWDRFQIPLPFSTCRIVWGTPLHVPPELTPEEIEAWCLKVGEALGGD